MLYKYTEKRFIHSFIHNGTIRIGTLNDYKENIEYDEVIGDKQEGKIEVSKHFNDSYPEGMTGWGFSVGKGSTIKNSVGFREDVFPNCYIYCLSRRLSPNIADSFKADGCIEIVDVIKFADLITDKLYELGLVEKSYIISPTFYFQNPGTDLDIPDIDPIALVKRLEYSYQEEVRILWTILKPKMVKPQIIDIGPLKEVVQRVDIGHNQRSEHIGTVFKNIRIVGGNLHFINLTIINSQFEKCKISIHSFVTHQYIGNVAFSECEFALTDDIQNGIQSLVNLSNTPGVNDLFASYITATKDNLSKNHS